MTSCRSWCKPPRTGASVSTEPSPLTVWFHGDKWTTFTEMFTDTCAAGERVADIAEVMGAYVEPYAVTTGLGGYLMRNIPNAIIGITEVVADYEIEEH